MCTYTNVGCICFSQLSAWLGLSRNCNFTSPRGHHCLPPLQCCSSHSTLQHYSSLRALCVASIHTDLIPSELLWHMSVSINGSLIMNDFVTLEGITFKWATKQFLYFNAYSFVIWLSSKWQNYRSLFSVFFFSSFPFFLISLFLLPHSGDALLKIRTQTTQLGREHGAFSLPAYCVTVPPKVQRQCGTLINIKAFFSDGLHGNRVNTCLWQTDLRKWESLQSHRWAQLELYSHMKNKHCNNKSPISSVDSGYCASVFKKLGK